MLFVKHPTPELEQLNLPNGRFYKTPDGTFPSVTTVLGSIPNPYLDEWREKVGDKFADEFSQKAADRGSFIHKCAEDYLLGNPVSFSMFQLSEKQMFNNLVPHLNEFQTIHALEQRIYSTKLRSAGTVDCIAEDARGLCVVDFKTSRRYKTRADIDSYFMQTAAYAIAWYERTGMAIGRVKILITTEDDGVLVYEENVKDWLPAYIEIRNKYLH